jgi:hypothetical protein
MLLQQHLSLSMHLDRFPSRGTEGPNPSPSSAESGANLTFSDYATLSNQRGWRNDSMERRLKQRPCAAAQYPNQ